MRYLMTSGYWPRGAPDLWRVLQRQTAQVLDCFLWHTSSNTAEYYYSICRSPVRIHIQVLLPNIRMKTRINAGTPQTLMWSITSILKTTTASSHQVGSGKTHSRDPPKTLVATTSRALGTPALPPRKEHENSGMLACVNYRDVQYNSCT